MKTIAVKLLPEQVSKYWDIVKYAIENSLPPTVYDHPDKMNRILSSILCESLDVWVDYTRYKDGIAKLEGVSLTQEVYDEPSDTKNLLIYSLYGYGPIEPSGWIQKLRIITEYAKDRGCCQLIAYSNVSRIIEVVKNLGGNADYSFLSFDIDKTVKKLNQLDEV